MTKLHSGNYLWPIYDVTDKLNCSALPEKIKCDVIVAGAGISGLLTAYELWKNHISVCIVEENKVAQGSTLASTGIIQYSSDISLTDLRARIGREKADCFYLASADAVHQIKAIADLLLDEVADSHFVYTPSIKFASSKDDVIQINQQYNAFKSIHVPCELIGTTQLEKILPNIHTEAIKTIEDAVLNPYLFVKYLATFLLRQGVPIYEHAKLSYNEENHSYLINANIPVISEHIIYTIGYQPEQLQEPDIYPILNRSYVIATEPIKQLEENYAHKQIIWETNHPYLYVRSTVDQRLIIGGLDEKIATPNENPVEIKKKNKLLLAALKNLYPKLEPTIAYSWNATFAESKDVLPFIGPSYTYKNRSYLCGYGGNGTVYSMLGAHLLSSYITSPEQYKNNLLAQVVKLKR